MEKYYFWIAIKFKLTVYYYYYYYILIFYIAFYKIKCICLGTFANSFDDIPSTSLYTFNNYKFRVFYTSGGGLYPYSSTQRSALVQNIRRIIFRRSRVFDIFCIYEFVFFVLDVFSLTV